MEELFREIGGNLRTEGGERGAVAAVEVVQNLAVAVGFDGMIEAEAAIL